MANPAYAHVAAMLTQLDEHNVPRARTLALQYAVVCGLRSVNAQRLAQLRRDAAPERRAFVDAEQRAALDRERRVREFALVPFIENEVGECAPS
jgi:hypothetical protein